VQPELFPDKKDAVHNTLTTLPQHLRIEIMQMLSQHADDWCQLANAMLYDTEPKQPAACLFCRQQMHHVHAVIYAMEQLWGLKEEDCAP
jgi:hypothetical protein